MAFQIDSSTVKEPITFQWEPPTELGIDHTQKPIYGTYRAAVANFNVMTAAQFKAWNDADNAAYHSIQCPTPDGTSSATYTNVIIRRMSGEYGPGGEIYGASFRVERLTV